MELTENPTESDLKAVAEFIIRSAYTRGTVAIETLERDSQGLLSGIFLGDGVKFRYTLQDGVLSYAPVNPADLPGDDDVSLS
jgi:hypothetical protein